MNSTPLPNSELLPVRCFLSFADTRMKASLNRISAQAQETSLFDKILIFTEESLDEDFREKWNAVLRRDVRGYGYYVWKPYVIWKVLESLPEGSFLLYCDAGSHINLQAKGKIQSYFKALEKDSLGIKAFRVSALFHGKERHWTKGDVFDSFCCRGNREVTESAQYESGHILFRKCERSMEFLREWYEVYLTNFSLVDDSKSKSPDMKEFFENRHDQSVFSVLYKINGGMPLPDGDTMSDIRFNALQGKRDTVLHTESAMDWRKRAMLQFQGYVKYVIIKCRWYLRLLH